MTRTPYMPLYFSWSHILSDLSDAEYGKLLKAVVAYAEGNTETPELPRHLALAYRFITDTIDRSGRKSAKSAYNTPEPHTETEKSADTAPEIPTEEAETEVNQANDTAETIKIESKQESDSTKMAKAEEIREVDPAETEKEIENQPSSATTYVKIEDNCAKASTNSEDCREIANPCPTSRKFTPPTLESVEAHFKTQGYLSDPKEFYNFYSSNGWLVGQNPMRNWQASAANWEIKVRRERKTQTTSREALNASHGSPNGSQTAQKAQSPYPEKPRAGTFDVHEAFKKALERSYGGFYDDDDEEEE